MVMNYCAYKATNMNEQIMNGLVWKSHILDIDGCCLEPSNLVVSLFTVAHNSIL